MVVAGGCGGIGSAFVLRFVNDGAAAVAVLDLDTSRANKLIEAVGAMTTTKSAASETKSKVKLCFSFVVSGAFFNYVDQILRKLTQFSKFNNFLIGMLIFRQKYFQFCIPRLKT